MNANLMSLTIIIGCVSILIGLILFFLILFSPNIRKDYARSYNTLGLSWVFIAFGLASLLFLLFPQSTSSGTVLGFSVGGAVALFMLVWFFGVKLSRDVLKFDDPMQKLQKENQDLKDKLQELNRQGIQASGPTELHHEIPYIYRMRNKRSKKIALITGRIEDVKEADAWVSSENTDMQMARFYDRSISGVIRYYGAKRDTSGNVIDDTIAKELKNQIGNSVPVSPTTVFVTSSGELQKDNKVKKIFHVASVRGEAGVGYVPINNIQFCIREVLKAVDSEENRSIGIKTILFPLLGAGTARGIPEEIAPKLIKAAASYFEAAENSAIECVYFLCRTDFERDACLVVLKELVEANKLELVSGSY